MLTCSGELAASSISALSVPTSVSEVRGERGDQSQRDSANSYHSIGARLRRHDAEIDLQSALVRRLTTYGDTEPAVVCSV
jgi:hypothetical protein